MSRPTQVLKTKKPEHILLQVRNKKLAELGQYKEESSDKKYKDIQDLLKMMNKHAKLPKTAVQEEAEAAKAAN